MTRRGDNKGGLRHTFTLLLILSFTGCAPLTTSIPPASWSGETETLRVVAAGTRKVMPPKEAIALLSRQRVIYVGEEHGSPAHHLVQALVIEGLVSIGKRPVIAVEWVEARFQPVLDAWVKGRITTQALQKDLEWEARWGHSFKEPFRVLELARVHSLPLVALNAERELVRRVAKVGRAALEDHELAKCPPLNTGNRAHRARIKQAHERHAHGHAPSFERFYQAQLAWDETMANGVTRILDDGADLVVVLAGSGHVDHRFGIPERVPLPPTDSARIVIPVPQGGMAHHSTEFGHLTYPARRGDLYWEVPLTNAQSVSH